MAKQRTAGDIMKSPVISAKKDMLVSDVINLMAIEKINGMPVLDDEGRMIGIITGRLMMNTAVSGNATRTTVAEVMLKHLDIYGPTFPPDTPVELLVNYFTSSRINRIFIVEDDRVVGIISRIDIICVLDQIYSQFIMI
jgi:CBS domain-containing protein